MSEISLLLLLIFGVSVAALSLKLIFDFAKGKSRYLALNTEGLACPRCEQSLPLARRPADLRQAFWGGWTCSECGAEIDRYGTDISTEKRFDFERPEELVGSRVDRLIKDEDKK